MGAPEINLLVFGSRLSLLENANEDIIRELANRFYSRVRELEARAGRPLSVKFFPPPPTAVFDVSKCVNRVIMFGRSASTCEFTLDDVDDLAKKQAMFTEELSRLGLFIYPLNDALCPSGRCAPLIGVLRIYRDNGHLRNEASAYLAQRLSALAR